MFVQNRTQEAIWKTCKTWCIDAKSINMFLKYRLYVVICIRYVKYVVCLMECRPYDCVGEIQSFEMVIYHIYIFYIYLPYIYIYISIYHLSGTTTNIIDGTLAYLLYVWKKIIRQGYVEFDEISRVSVVCIFPHL